MKFFTNKIPTGSSKMTLSQLIENKIAAKNQSQTQVKTASGKEEEKVRKDVHGVEGSPNDGNGEPEKDGENKTVESQAVTTPTSTKPVVKTSPAAPKAVAPVAKPAVAKPAVAPVAKSTVKTSPVAPKINNPISSKPAIASAEVKEEDEEKEVESCEAGSASDVKVAETESSDETKRTGVFPDDFKPEQKAEEDGKAEVKASNKTKFEKIANLTPKQKNFLKKFWSMIHPPQYVDNMVQDK